MTLDFSRCRYAPFQHQREDTAWLIEHPFALIASEMRTGKSKICVDAMQFLYEMLLINRVLIVAPAPVRDVWYDPKLGELAKHLWPDLHATITEFHARIRSWVHGAHIQTERPLDIYCTNYEFLRSRNRVVQLLPACDARTLLILDESSFVKSHNAEQTKACLQLRRACGRVVMLNGTPIFHSPLDLFSQGNLLDPSILDCKYVTYFKARYALQQPVLGFGGRVIKTPFGKPVQKITGWTNLDDLQRRFAPYTVRRLQKECLDLPPKLDPVTLTATLDSSWPSYKEMRDNLVVWLESGNVATSATAAVKTLRLSQITSGFLGGVETANIGDESCSEIDDLCSTVFGVDSGFTDIVDSASTEQMDDGTGTAARVASASSNMQEIGREKLDVLLWFIEQRLAEDQNLHLVAWCRFRVELFRMLNAVAWRFPQFIVGAIHGGQKKQDRLSALALLKPETSPSGPLFVAGIEGTGSFGLDMTAAHTCVTVSSGYSPGRSAQTLDRVYGPGQKFPIAYYDIVAVGPKGQKTIDRDILLARRAGQDVATWTSDAWVKVLKEE